MRIVSENSEADLARERAKHELDWAIRELTANLIRITRGAGKSYEVGTQCVAVLNALKDYHDAAGEWPYHELANSLLLLDDRAPATGDEFAVDLYYAEEAIVRGALQHRAAKLLGQHLQVAAGEREMYDGIKLLNDARECERRRWAAETRTAKQRQAVVARAIAMAEKGKKGRKKKPPGRTR